MVLIGTGIGFLFVYLINNDWLQYQCQAIAWIHEEFEYLRRQFEFSEWVQLNWLSTIGSHSVNHLTKTLIHSPNPNWSRSAINDWISTEGDQTHVIASQPSSASAPWLQWTPMRLTEAELTIRSWWRCLVDSRSLNNIFNDWRYLNWLVELIVTTS